MSGVMYVSIDKIEVRKQVRTVMDEGKLKELSESIKEHGVIEPLVVRAKSGGNGEYILRIGERRLRAAKMAGKDKVPVLVKNDNDDRAFLQQLVENLQREDMNDMDVALAFQKMQEEMGKDVKTIAKDIGKSEAYVAQRMRLLKLDPKVQEALRVNDIDFGGARALCSLSKTEQVSALEEAIKEEEEARKKRAEMKPSPTTLPGFNALDEEPELENEVAASGDGDAPTTDAKKAKAKAKKAKAAQPKKTKTGKAEAKATAKTVKRVTKRRQRAKAGAQAVTKPVQERLEERTKEWTDAYLDEKTKGKGLEDGLSATKVKNLLKGFVEFLHEKKALIVR